MSKNFNSIYRDILNNQKLNDNIPEFLNSAFDKYDTNAKVRLALSYYTYYEMYIDERENWTSSLHDHLEKINNIISDAVLQTKSSEEVESFISQIDKIRNNVTKGMETLSLYVDLFEAYEYALNRVEYRFKKIDQIENDDELAKQILRYIFDSEDNVMVNNRIKEIIGQLPIRITKQKYFDYMRDGFHQYVGANVDVLETLTYIIRSCASLDISHDMKEAYPKLWDKKEKLEKIDFKDITQEEYEAAILLVQDAAVFLEVESTAFYSLIEIINELYIILLCTPYIDMDMMTNGEHKEAAFHIIRGINEAFVKGEQEDSTSDLLATFGVLEGVQEDMEYDIIRLEDTLFYINNNQKALVKSLGKEKQLYSLLLCKDLQSGSLFIDLNNHGTDVTVDRDRIIIDIDMLINELEDKFRSSDRMIIRAIMANTLDKLPVFFNSHTEVMEYVLYSLNKCTDMAEKYASIEIITSLMD